MRTIGYWLYQPSFSLPLLHPAVYLLYKKYANQSRRRTVLSSLVTGDGSNSSYLPQCTAQSIDRVPGFLSSRPNRLPPLPRPRRVLPSSLCLRGGTHALAGEGAGGPIRTKVQTLWYCRYSIIPLRCTVKEDAGV
jgi:hypothetical protein